MNRSVVSHLAAAAALLLVSSGTLLAQFSITSSPSSVNFNYASGTTGALEQQITISTNSLSTAIFSAFTSSTAVSVSPSSGTVSASGTTLRVRIDNPAAFTAPTTVQLTVNSQSPGLSPLTIPININPGSASGGAYTAYPSSLVFNYTPGTATAQSQSVTVSGPAFGSYSVGFDSGTANPYLSVTPNAVSTGSAVSVTLNPISAPNAVTTTNLRFTPLNMTSGLAMVVVPITLQPYGTSVSSIVANPSLVTFAYPTNTTGALTQTVNLSSSIQTPLTPTFSASLAPYLSIPYPIGSVGNFQIVLANPASVPATTSGTLTLTPAASTGIAPLTLQISIVPGGTSGSSGLTVTPTSVNFSFTNGTTQQLSQQLQVNSAATVLLTPTISGLGNLISIPQNIYTNSPFTIYLLSPALVTQPTSGTLTLTPPAGSGLGSISVPIQLTPSGTSGSGLATSPTSLNFSYPTSTTASQTLYLQLSSPITTTVTITPSSNIASYISYPTTALTGSQIAFTISNPSAVPAGTVGSFTITPSTTGLSAISVPVYINSTGGGTGTNIITVTPASLTFNMQSGGAAPVEQTISLTDPNNVNTFITVNVNSDNNFLQITQSSGSIPSTLTVRVDTSNVREARQYNGTITVVRLRDLSVLATIPVTLNVTPAVKVTPVPTSVNLNSFAGSTTAVTQSVQVNGDVSGNFGTTVATTTGGNWLSVTPTTGTLGSSVTISANPSSLTAGTYQGTVTITISGAPAVSIPVTLTVAQPSSLQLGSTSLSFNYQTTGSSNPPAQSFTVAASGGVTLNYTATATSTGNWLSVTPASGATPGSVSVSVNPAGLAPGAYQGTVSVASASATNTPQTVNVTLTVTAPTLPLITSVLNAASLNPTLTTPGGILTIRGTNMGPATGVSGTVVGGLLQTTAGGVTVTFDGVPAPVLYASATQLNIVAPYEVASRATSRVVVTYQGQSSLATDLRVTDTAPALFAASGGGTGPAAALNQNGTVNTPSTPELRGNIVVLFGTGEGVTNPTSTTGQVSDTLRRIAAPVTVRIGGQIAEVLYAGSMPGAVAGAFQLNVRVPQNIGAGQQPVDVQIGASSTQASVTIAVQ